MDPLIESWRRKVGKKIAWPVWKESQQRQVSFSRALSSCELESFSNLMLTCRG